MPAKALKHLAKKAGVSLDRAEHLWDKSKEIVDAEYPYDKKDDRYWALRMGITKKMLGLSEMITFKTFLEAAVKEPPNFKSIPKETALDLIDAHCSKAKWMLTSKDVIFRGDGGAAMKVVSHTGFATVDPSATERKSQNTMNHYTVVIDNTPSLKDYPRRSRSFIASSYFHTAVGFTGSDDENEVMVLIPYNQTKIGVVPESDMWVVTIELFGRRMSLENFPTIMYHDLDIQPTWESFVDFANDVNVKPIMQKMFYRVFPGATKGAHSNFLEELDKAFSPQNIGFELVDGGSFRTKDLSGNELWVGGPCIAIHYPVWKKMVNERKK